MPLPSSIHAYRHVTPHPVQQQRHQLVNHHIGRLAAISLILPALTGIVPVLTPLAALGLVLVMMGAIVTHLRRGESQVIVVNLVLLALAAFVVYGRFVAVPL